MLSISVFRVILSGGEAEVEESFDFRSDICILIDRKFVLVEGNFLVCWS